MKKRRAPKNGYDNDEKQKYRHNVWSHLSKKALPILEKDENSKVLMMPSAEGIEIDVAMEYGIKADQIIAIDENPALLAHAKWKDKIPKENRFGCKVSEIGTKIKKKAWYFAAANLDFCNNFSDELINESMLFFKNTPMLIDFTFSITMMKGRETKALVFLIKNIKDKYDISSKRISAWCEIMKFPNKKISEVLFEGNYFDSSPMSYCIFQLDQFEEGEIFTTKLEAEKIFNSFFDRSIEEIRVEWPIMQARIENYLQYLSDRNKSSEKWLNKIDLSLLEIPLSDQLLHENMMDDVRIKYKIPAGVWDSEDQHIHHKTRERIIRNLKQWFKGNLTERACYDLYFFLDERLDLDWPYIFYGIPIQSKGDFGLLLEPINIARIGTGNKKLEGDDEKYYSGIDWGACHKGTTELSYFFQN